MTQETFSIQHATLSQKTVAWISQNLFAAVPYRQHHGFAHGMRRVGGLGWVPAKSPMSAKDRFLEDYPMAGLRVVDIGAFEGLMTLGFARKGASRIWAFEPARRNRKVLTRNIAANRLQNVTVFDVALADAPGESTLSYDSVRPSKASLGPGTERVRVATLDEFSLDPDLIKIDVEGFELPVLQGAVETLRRHRPKIVLELHGHTVELKKSKTHGILDFLQAQGYHATHIETQQPADAERHYEGHLYAENKSDFSQLRM